MLPGSVGAFDGRATGGRLGSPTIATIQLVLKRDEEAIDRTSALNEEQGFRATNCPDRVKLNARVRSIHASKPQMRLKERPAGERARKRVYETCSSQRVTHEVAHFIKWHGHDLLRNVSGLDFFLRALQRLQLTHMGSVSPATRRERAWTRFDGPLTCRFTCARPISIGLFSNNERRCHQQISLNGHQSIQDIGDTPSPLGDETTSALVQSEGHADRVAELSPIVLITLVHEGQKASV